MATKGQVDIKINANDKASAKMKTIGANADQMAKKFAMAGAGMVAVGGAIIVGMAKMVNSYAKAGDEVAKMADRTGIGTEALSEMRHVAQLSGTDLNAFEKAIRTMQGAIVDGQAGLETYTRAFERIGIDVQDLKGMKPEEQFWLIADGISAMTDDTERAATAADIFGARVGTQLLPMLESGSIAIADMKQEAHDLNLVFSEDAAQAAEDFVDAKTRLTGALTGIGNTIAQSVLPEFQKFVDMLTEKLKPAMAWLEEHPEVTQAFLKFGAIFVVGGIMMLGIAAFIKVINMALIPAIIKATIAFIAMQAASGPKGWLVLAGAAAVAAAAIYGLSKALGMGLGGGGVEEHWLTRYKNQYPGQPVPTEAPPPGKYWYPLTGGGFGLASLQHGGIVPGPIGQPVPIIAHGGEQFAGVGNTLGTTINVNVAGSVIAERDLAATIREEFLKIKNRNSTLGFA